MLRSATHFSANFSTIQTHLFTIMQGCIFTSSWWRVAYYEHLALVYIVIASVSSHSTCRITVATPEIKTPLIKDAFFVSGIGEVPPMKSHYAHSSGCVVNGLMYSHLSMKAIHRTLLIEHYSLVMPSCELTSNIYMGGYTSPMANP